MNNFEEQMFDTWKINNRINLYMIEAIPTTALSDRLASKGRTVAQQFAHLHNARLMWLKASAPELLNGLAKIERSTAVSKEMLQDCLEASGEAIGLLLRKGIDNDGKIKGFKPHVTAFLGYLIAHDAHHRGQIALALKQSGHRLPEKIAYGIWEWGSR